MEDVFQLIFHYTTKHQKIIHFSEIHLKKLFSCKQTASKTASKAFIIDGKTVHQKRINPFFLLLNPLHV
jgi:hypothetical protein